MQTTLESDILFHFCLAGNAVNKRHRHSSFLVAQGIKLKAEHLGAEEVAGVLEYQPGTENRSQSSPALTQTSSYMITSDKVIFISLCPSSLSVKW